MSKLETIKELEYLVAFQTECLQGGDWDNFDKLESKIKKLEEEISKSK